jgi:hypothetical protein
MGLAHFCALCWQGDVAISFTLSYFCRTR